MSKLRSEILELSLMTDNKMVRINSLDDKYSAYLYKDPLIQGVFIKYNFDLDIFNEFANLTLKTMYLGNEKVLLLSTSRKTELKIFSLVAENFLLPKNRKIIEKNPYNWCEEWSELIGNVKKHKLVSDVIAELYVYNHLVDNYKGVNWGASNKTTNDFQLEDFNVEVKSTTLKSSSVISINSKFQLQGESICFLYFCRLEKVRYKYTIDNLVADLVSKGISKDYLEEELTRLGYPKGIKERHESYEILELRAYNVEKNKFPLISLEDINKLGLTSNIVNFKLDFDLTGIDYIKIK